MRAYPIPMEEAATTVPRSTPHRRRSITPVATATTPSRVVTTRHRPGITSQPHGITTSRGFINRLPVITSRNEATTGAIRITNGAAVTVAAGTTTTVARVDAITVDEETMRVAAIMVIEVTEVVAGNSDANL